MYKSLIFTQKQSRCCQSGGNLCTKWIWEDFFFDAIEWAITGTIERLNTGKPIKEEVKNEEGYILKNKDSNEKYGTVTIISAEDAVLSVNTKEKKGT